MRIVTLKQNGREWHAWRGKGLGASDAPVVMGDSPWQTPFGLWLDKTGICKREEPNEYQLAAMRRGHELEPEIRKRMEQQLGMEFSSLSAEHDEFSYIRASFDGYNEKRGVFIEIKAPNKDDHAKAVSGLVPTKYKAQLQQQFLVSGASRGYYGSWSGKLNELVAIVPVMPDFDYQKQLLESLHDFWRRVEMQMAPALQPGELNKLAARAGKLQTQLASILKALEIGLEV